MARQRCGKMKGKEKEGIGHGHEGTLVKVAPAAGHVLSGKLKNTFLHFFTLFCKKVKKV